MPSLKIRSPRLRAGLHVVRRDAARVQIGLDAPHRVILPADPDCLALLEKLRHGTATGPLDATQARIVRELGAADLLVEHRDEPYPTRSVALHDHGFGEATGRLEQLLVEGGVEVTSETAAELVVACSAAPLPRAVIDPWLAEGTPHLVLTGTGHPGSLRVGPLVEPGLTACLRCIDSAEASNDPRRPLLVEQLAVRSPAPIDAVTLALALALAARDIVSFLTGQPATTWSATVDAHAPLPRVRRWERHPDCGCCWDELPY